MHERRTITWDPFPACRVILDHVAPSAWCWAIAAPDGWAWNGTAPDLRAAIVEVCRVMAWEPAWATRELVPLHCYAVLGG